MSVVMIVFVLTETTGVTIDQRSAGLMICPVPRRDGTEIRDLLRDGTGRLRQKRGTGRDKAFSDCPAVNIL